MPDDRSLHPDQADLLYLDLKGSLERLSRAQTHMPAHWRSDAQTAIDIVTPGGMQNAGVINESGLYALAFGSRLETARTGSQMPALALVAGGSL